MLKEVIDVLSQFTDYPADQITAETDLVDELELNSFDVFTIVSDFEDQYGVSISDDAIVGFKKVGDIVEYLEEHRA